MDLTDQEQEERRARLREWVRTAGGHAAVVAKRRLSQGQASYLSQVINGYSFGSRAARNMERRLGMEPKWLDGAVATMHAQQSPGRANIAAQVAPPPLPGPRFADRREVSDSDWALLNDIKTAMESPRLAAQVDELRREAQAMEAFAAKVHRGSS